MFKLIKLLKEDKEENKEDFILNFKPFEELKEDYSEEDILSDDDVESLMKELEDLKVERKELRALPNDQSN